MRERAASGEFELILLSRSWRVLRHWRALSRSAWAKSGRSSSTACLQLRAINILPSAPDFMSVHACDGARQFHTPPHLISGIMCCAPGALLRRPLYEEGLVVAGVYDHIVARGMWVLTSPSCILNGQHEVVRCVEDQTPRLGISLLAGIRLLCRASQDRWRCLSHSTFELINSCCCCIILTCGLFSEDWFMKSVLGVNIEVCLGHAWVARSGELASCTDGRSQGSGDWARSPKGPEIRSELASQGSEFDGVGAMRSQARPKFDVQSPAGPNPARPHGVLVAPPLFEARDSRGKGQPNFGRLPFWTPGPSLRCLKVPEERWPRRRTRGERQPRLVHVVDRHGGDVHACHHADALVRAVAGGSWGDADRPGDRRCARSAGRAALRQRRRHRAALGMRGRGEADHRISGAAGLPWEHPGCGMCALWRSMGGVAQVSLGGRLFSFWPAALFFRGGCGAMGAEGPFESEKGHRAPPEVRRRRRSQPGPPESVSVASARNPARFRAWRADFPAGLSNDPRSGAPGRLLQRLCA